MKGEGEGFRAGVYLRVEGRRAGVSRLSSPPLARQDAEGDIASVSSKKAAPNDKAVS